MFASLELLLLEHSLGQSLSGNKKKRESCSSCATSISDGTKTNVYVVTQRLDSSHLLVNSLAILLMQKKCRKNERKLCSQSFTKKILPLFWRHPTFKWAFLQLLWLTCFDLIVFSSDFMSVNITYWNYTLISCFHKKLVVGIWKKFAILRKKIWKNFFLLFKRVFWLDEVLVFFKSKLMCGMIYGLQN